MTNGNKTNAPGFTLMEMMVAVALMAMMIAVFGTVISRTKDAVTFAQSTIQRERESAAVSGIIQRDMAMITNKGFLKVEDGAIAFSVTGPNESVLARDYGDLSADAVKDTTSGDDAGKSWAADTWKGGYIRFTEAVETGTLQTVTEFTGTDMVDKGWAPDQYAGSIVKITGVSESGTGITRMVTENTSRMITVDPAWSSTVAASGDEVDLPDLLVYHKFNDTGQMHRDYSLNDNPATPTGVQPTPVEGWNPADPTDFGARLDSADTYQYPMAKWQKVADNNYLSVSLWVTVYTGPGDCNRVFLFPLSGPSATRMSICGGPHNDARPYTDYIWPSGRGWASYGGMYRTAVLSNYNVGYHHIAMVMGNGTDGNETWFYIDGSAWLDGGSHSDNFWPNGSVGTFNDSRFRGQMDEVAAWGRRMTLEQIQQLAAQTHVPRVVGTTSDGPVPGDTYGLFFPPYEISGNTSDGTVTVYQPWTATVPAGTDYTLYFASNSALVNYGRISTADVKRPANTLWRRLYLLVPGAAFDHDDVLQETVESFDNDDFRDHCNDKQDAGGAQDDRIEITLPPSSTLDWFYYLVGNCTAFEAAVYDQYDSDGDNGGNAHWDSNWSSVKADGSRRPPAEWPTAVRIRYTLRGQQFEVQAKVNE